MYFQSTILLFGIISPWLATAIISPRGPTFDTRSPSIDTNIPLVSINKNLPLRILPLGDSITWGYLSSDGNGYRLALINLLSSNAFKHVGTENENHKVEYIGTQRSGKMTGNHNEGHPGAVITQIEEYATAMINEPPNVVLLMAGMVDILREVDPSNAPERLGHLIDEIVKVFPRAAVLVANIPPLGDADADARAVAFNAAIPSLVSTRVAEGRRIQVVNMRNYLTVDDLQDVSHPTYHGYSLIARAWYDGIRAAESRMWLAPPVSKRRGKYRKRDLSTTCSTSTTEPTTTLSTSTTESTTTLTSTTTTTSTITATYSTVSHTLKSTTTYTVPTTKTTTCTTSTSSSPSVPTFAPTLTSIPFPNDTTSVITIPTFSAPASISIPSGTATPTSSGGGTSLPPVPTNDASRLAGNLWWMATGLIFFWLSGMAM